MFTNNLHSAAACGKSDDSGFTIIEIVMALSILLIAFSGVMSLMMANTYMNVKAKEKASLVNEANSYIERVRQMRFDDIGTATSTPSGTLAAYTTTTNGYVIVVTPTVTPMTDSGIVNTSGVPIAGVLKKLSIVLAAHRAGTTGPIVTFNAETIIKKTDSGILVDAQKPTINPTSSTPTSDAVVYGNAVNIGAIASANGDGVVLTSMNFYCDGVPLVDASGNSAQWGLHSATYASPTFLWDTTALNEDGVPMSADGEHVIKLEVWDSNSGWSFYQWTVVVDNAAPVWPGDGWITAAPTSSTSMQLAWSPVFDGNVPTHHYNIRSQKLIFTTWGTAVLSSYMGDAGIATTAPFSKYRFSVTAVGPPPLNRESESGSNVIATSRPEILSTSSWRVDKVGAYMLTYVTIKLSPNTFPIAGVKSVLYKSTDISMSNPTQVGLPFTVTSASQPPEFAVESIKDNFAKAYYYQVVTGPTVSSVWTPQYSSQVVGPSGTKDQVATPFTTARW